MDETNCKACGMPVSAEATTCPHCGAEIKRSPLWPWVVLFFIIGVLMGLMFLSLQSSGTPSWLENWQQNNQQQPAAVEQGAKPRVLPAICDREKAQAVWQKAREMATMVEHKGMLELRLGKDWEYYTAGHRSSFVNTFAEADQCLQGSQRPIRFLFRGAEVATVSATGAVETK